MSEIVLEKGMKVYNPYLRCDGEIIRIDGKLIDLKYDTDERWLQWENGQHVGLVTMWREWYLDRARLQKLEALAEDVESCGYDVIAAVENANSFCLSCGYMLKTKYHKEECAVGKLRSALGRLNDGE